MKTEEITVINTRHWYADYPCGFSWKQTTRWLCGNLAYHYPASQPKIPRFMYPVWSFPVDISG